MYKYIYIYIYTSDYATQSFYIHIYIYETVRRRLDKKVKQRQAKTRQLRKRERCTSAASSFPFRSSITVTQASRPSVPSESLV